MQSIMSLISSHPVQSTLAAKALWDSIVGALAAPSKDSSPYYVFLFKLMNSLAFNFQRANSTSIEKSPNFVAAAQQYIAQLPPEEIARIKAETKP